MKKLLLCLLVPASLAHAQSVPSVSLQAGAVIALPAGAAPSALALADFNQDFRRDRDIAVCQRGLGSVAVYLQTSGGNFPNPAAGTYAAGLRPSGLVVVPLGRAPARPSIDLVAISGPSSSYTLLTNNNDGTGTFTPVAGPARNTYFGFGNLSLNPQLLARDLDNNGLVDFVFTYDSQTFTIASNGIYRQELLNSTTVDTPYKEYFQTFYTPASLALDDFDRDGALDLVTTNANGHEFTVAFSDNPGQPGPCWRCAFSSRRQAQPSLGLRPVHVATADVNRDQLPDLALAHEGSSEVTLLLNLRNYQFGAAASYPLSGAPRKVALRDLNNDLYPELLVLTADNRLQVFQHTGSTGVSRYGTPLTLATGADPVTMELDDMNGDGLTDVVVGCAGDNTVRVFLNRSGVVSAARAPQLAGVSVSPNPATDRVTIQRPTSLTGPLTAVLLDALGREVRQVAVLAPAGTLSVAGLPQGVYVLRLSAPAGVSSQRLVVE